jgi:hypothetical protein
VILFKVWYRSVKGFSAGGHSKSPFPIESFHIAYTTLLCTVWNDRIADRHNCSSKFIDYRPSIGKRLYLSASNELYNSGDIFNLPLVHRVGATSLSYKSEL